MDRKLNKNELDLWKEVTKEDIKLKNYISENSLEQNTKILKKQTKDINKNLKASKIIDKIPESSILVSPGKLQINKRMKSKLERGLIRPEALLDLHGYNRIEAQKSIESFIKTCIYQEKRCILIITGKKKSIFGSKSILRELVPKWLNEKKFSSLVLAHCFANQRDGGDGARYILLRKKENNNE